MTDHGTEYYAVNGGKGKSKLDRYCKERGVKHIYARIRHLQTNGKMERTHRSAKEETPYFGTIRSFDEAKQTFMKWIEYHNTDCAHRALGYEIPINVYFVGSMVTDLIRELAE